MKIKTPFFDIKIDILFLIVMFIFLLYSKIRVFLESYFICYLFIIFHETSHMFIATTIGKSIETFNVSIFGVSITLKKERYNIKNNIINKKIYIKDIIMYIAGPMSNFILALIFHNIKIVFDINIFLGILNLIPIYPLDGYNILRNLLLIKFQNNKVDRIINIINYILFIMFFLFGIISMILFCNPSLILFLIYLIILKNSNIKVKKMSKKYK